MSHIKLFQQIELVNFYIYMTCRLPNAKNYCKGSLFTYGCINQGVKHWLFLSKYRLKVVKVKDFKIIQGGSKTFQKRLVQNRECLNIANLVNTPELSNIGSTGGQITYDLLKELKQRKRKELVISNRFNQSSLQNFNI